jgi:putative membrane protein
MVKSLLSEADAREVEAAVKRVEAQSAAEVVVAVLPQSREYWQGRVLLAVLWGLGAGLAFLVLEPWQEPIYALAIEVLVGVGAFALGGFLPLQRRLFSAEVARQAVQARAFQLFAERGLQATSGRTALLIFVSELERRVVLLGDRRLHAEVGQQGWEEHVARLLEHIRAGHARAGLLEALERLGPQLAAVAPRLPNDENELPDAVLRA